MSPTATWSMLEIIWRHCCFCGWGRLYGVLFLSPFLLPHQPSRVFPNCKITSFWWAWNHPQHMVSGYFPSPSDFFIFHCWRSCLLNTLWSSIEELVDLCSAWCCFKEQKNIRISCIYLKKKWEIGWGMLAGLFWMKLYPQSNWIKEKKFFRWNRLFMFAHSILLQNKGCWALSNYLSQLLRILLHTRICAPH